MTIITGAIGFLFAITVLVLVHEFGHFIVARILNIGVESFSIGFGPKIFEIKKGRVAYQLRWILLGGFVKLKGEMGDEGGSSSDPESFVNHKRWERFFVFVMGATFNIALAYLIFVGIAMNGVEESFKNLKPEIQRISAGSPADVAGIKVGDSIVSIDDKTVSDWEDVQKELIIPMNQKRKITIDRDGGKIDFHVEPVIVKFLGQDMGGDIGIYALPSLRIIDIRKGSPAEIAGLRATDEIVSVNELQINSYESFVQKIQDCNGRAIIVKIKRNGSEIERKILPAYDKISGRYMIGIALSNSTIIKYQFLPALKKGGDMVLDSTAMLWRFIKSIAERKASISGVGGPISMAYVVGYVANEGWYTYIATIAFISLQLGIINLLPIPALDGGHIFVLLIESTIRRDFPLKLKERLIQVGFICLIALMAGALLLDIYKFF